MSVTKVKVELELTCDNCGTPIKIIREQGNCDTDMERYGLMYALGIRERNGNKVYCCDNCKTLDAEKEAIND